MRSAASAGFLALNPQRGYLESANLMLLQGDAGGIVAFILLVAVKLGAAYCVKLVHFVRSIIRTMKVSFLCYAIILI